MSEDTLGGFRGRCRERVSVLLECWSVATVGFDTVECERFQSVDVKVRVVIRNQN